ncbi:hypothetical protein TNIN_405571 [Trichonephila inaurata madagascariensis]|uniref:Uncharacterized protein n=1 Tax=Trichonephila inaurata madagascariensis TaxID=2747483 RepID=A0A8X6XPQ0_9ARAC|nr:hypothetical protein TNIN_405571 [Trichonephila inaurata madagascariensis]
MFSRVLVKYNPAFRTLLGIYYDATRLNVITFQFIYELFKIHSFNSTFVLAFGFIGKERTASKKPCNLCIISHNAGEKLRLSMFTAMWHVKLFEAVTEIRENEFN